MTAERHNVVMEDVLRLSPRRPGQLARFAINHSDSARGAWGMGGGKRLAARGLLPPLGAAAAPQGEDTHALTPTPPGER